MIRSAIVVSGLPASGKTSIGQTLATRLEFAFLDKDDFLERLYEQEPVRNLAHRNELSRLSDEHFVSAARDLQNAVLVSHWQPRGKTGASGTSVDWLATAFDHLIEVHCKCSPEIATERFLARTRHPGHLDRLRGPLEISAKMQEWSAGLPLRLGGLIEIETTADVNIETVVEAINLYLIET